MNSQQALLAGPVAVVASGSGNVMSCVCTIGVNKMVTSVAVDVTFNV